MQATRPRPGSLPQLAPAIGLPRSAKMVERKRHDLGYLQRNNGNGSLSRQKKPKANRLHTPQTRGLPLKEKGGIKHLRFHGESFSFLLVSSSDFMAGASRIAGASFGIECFFLPLYNKQDCLSENRKRGSSESCC